VACKVAGLHCIPSTAKQTIELKWVHKQSKRIKSQQLREVRAISWACLMITFSGNAGSFKPVAVLCKEELKRPQSESPYPNYAAVKYEFI